VTALAQLGLFLSSYAPLFGVFALLDSFGTGAPSKACLGLTIVGLVSPVVVRPVVRRSVTPQDLHVETAVARDSDALAYIATYLVPFAAVTATTDRERIALAMFVFLIALLYVRGHLFYINPLFAIVGYRLFQVTTPAGASVTLLSRRPFLPAKCKVSARRLSDYVYWEA
jgi:hypothetical protein